MKSSSKRSLRRASLLLMLPLLAMTCGGPRAQLPLCTTTVSQEPTGDLASDLVGAWQGTTDEEQWHHPIAYMVALPEAGFPGGRIWMFRDDGSGHLWWVQGGGETRDYENDEEFVWEVVENQLVVNDLPPATVEVRSPTRAIIHPLDPSVDPLRGTGISRCDLEVPDGVRGFDARDN